jgi:hypothetical protein
MKNPGGEPDSHPAITIRILDQDEDVYELHVTAGDVHFEVITELVLEGDALIARGLHISGQGPGTASPSVLLAAARESGRSWNAHTNIIEGGVRTTGANPGHTPRQIIVSVD